MNELLSKFGDGLALAVELGLISDSLDDLPPVEAVPVLRCRP